MPTIVIPRSPYTMTATEDNMTLNISTETIEPGFQAWPVYEVDGRFYLQDKFELAVPKGADVIKVNLSTIRGIQVARCTITDEDTNVVWFKNASNPRPQYPYIGVTRNRVYKLKVDDMTEISADGTLKFEYSYDINNKTITVEDYVED